MAARRHEWLIPLMVLVMVVTAPLQAFAFLSSYSASACPVMTTHAASGVMDRHPATSMHDQHCARQGQNAAPNSSDTGASGHHNCGPSCTGSCGVCAHCPVGISSLSTAPDVPRKHFVLLTEHQPGDVPPDAALRPPRLFS